MKIYFLLLFFIFSQLLYSQDFKGKNGISISLMPAYQNWSIPDTFSFSEFTVSLNASYYAIRNTTISLSMRYAAVGGDLSDLSGFADAQLITSRKLEEYNVTLSAGLNIPSGKTKLDQNEFSTSRVVSQNLFNLRTANFGQGLNLFMGALWTQPLSEMFVFGAGLSYQVKSEYQPVSILSEKYQPANELSATLGFDAKFNETSTLTTDITGIFYGNDKIADEEILSAGNRIILTSLFRQYIDYNMLSVIVLYRAIGKGEYNALTSIIESEKVNPNQFYLGSVFSHRISSNTIFKYGFAVNSYEKTNAYFSGYTLFELSVAPEFRLSPMVTLPGIIKFAAGSADNKSNVSNFEIGVGIRLIL